MPSIPAAITITTSIVSPTVTQTGWGTGAIVGVSTATDKNTPKLYTSLESLTSEHGATSPVGMAGAAAFAQGIRQIYTVSVSGSPSPINPLDLGSALSSLGDLVLANSVRLVCLAGITADQTALMTPLTSFADRVDVVFVVTNPANASISAITTAASAISSPHGMFVAHATAIGDVAAAAMAALSLTPPGTTAKWREISGITTPGSFTSAAQETLETAHVNYLTDLQNNGTIRLSNDLSLAPANNPAAYIDITIARIYLTDQLRSDLANYLISTSHVPYTSVGIEYIRSVILATLARLVNNGIITEYTVTMPNIADIPSADIQSRQLSGIHVWARLPGSIHTLDIDLTLEAI